MLVTTKNGEFHLYGNTNPTNCNFFVPNKTVYCLRRRYWSVALMVANNRIVIPIKSQLKHLSWKTNPNQILAGPFWQSRENSSSCWKWGDKPTSLLSSQIGLSHTQSEKCGTNQGRLLFFCPNQKEDSGGYFKQKLSDASAYESPPHIVKVGCLFHQDTRTCYQKRGETTRAMHMQNTWFNWHRRKS